MRLVQRRPVVLLALAALVAGCASAPGQRLDLVGPGRPVMLLGEVHDNAAQHAQRAEALERLLATGARPALLMEQFDRSAQPAIDRLLARSDVTVAELVALGGPGWSWPLYEPYLALVLRYRLPLVAANLSRAEVRLVIAQGLAAQGFEARVPDDILQGQVRAIVAGHCGQIDETQAARLALAQIARDQFMARQVEAHAPRGAVLLAGNGHVRSDIGVPRWLSAATRARTVAIGLLEPGIDDPQVYDQTFPTPAQTRRDPCADFQAAPGMAAPASPPR